ncbi:MAG: fibronectin type III domain-containing protein, partial [Clostridiales bacterium]|nr:fibronectin type III domain-containing protein [Clostridiales bacterium]
NCSSLTEIVIPDSLFVIVEESFEIFTSLESVTLSANLVSIGDWAFNYCPCLTEMTFPDCVEHIGTGAFDYCTSLASINIPASLTEISENAFASCALTEITIPDTITAIGESGFGGNSQLETVVISDSVESIGYGAFSNCTSLTDITLPNGLTEIAEFLFYNCSSLESITIPDGVTYIGAGAFVWTGLTSVTIPDSVVSIGEQAFVCDNLTSVVLPATVEEIGEYAFGYYWAIDHISDEGCVYYDITPIEDYTIYGYTGTAAETYANDNENVTFVALDAENYGQCGDNVYWTLEDGVLTIYTDGEAEDENQNGRMWDWITTFEWRDDITSIVIEAGVTYIGAGAFEGCSVESLYIGADVSLIGEGAFLWCIHLSSIEVAEGNETYTTQDGVLFKVDEEGNLSELVLYPVGDDSRTSYDIPDGVRYIVVYALFHAESLESVTVPATVTDIGFQALGYTEIEDNRQVIEGFTIYGHADTAADTYANENEIEFVSIHYEGEAVTENEVEATCTEDGSYDTVVYCTVCGEELSRETVTVPATGHSYDEGVVTEPTCTEGGYTTYICTVCGETYTADETEATGHTEGEAVTENEVEATCTEDGSYDTVVYCTVCGEELSRETTVVPATGHSYGDPTFTWAEDYSTATVTFTCDTCGDTQTVDAEVTVNVLETSTCTRDGAASYTAIVTFQDKTYSDSKDAVVPATGHTEGEAVTEKEVAATCTEDGSYDSVVYCTVCGEELSRETTVVPATGHTWDEGTVTKEATDTEDGVMTYTCTVCGETKTEVIPATGTGTVDLGAGCTLTLSTSTYTYDGTAKTPTVTVKDANGNTLTEGVDYTVSYSDNTAVGTATVTVTGIGSYTGTATATFTIRCAAPTISSVSNTTSGVKVTWSEVTGATGYRVYRKADGETSWTAVKSSTTSTSYTDTTAQSGTVYSYTVRAYTKVNGSNIWGSYDASGKSIVRLNAPTLSSVSNAASGITVKWTQVEGAQGYRIYRKAGSASSWTAVKTVSGGSTLSWTDTSVSNGTKYTYTVRAYSKATGSTCWGAYNSTGKVTYRLTRPTISSLKNSSSKKMTVKWDKNSKATGYQIQYSTSSSFSSYKTVTVTSASTVSKTISSLTKGKTYYVRVRAYKTVSGTKYYSAWSATKNVKISK